MEEEITLKDVVEEESAGKDSFEEIGTSVLADAEHFRLKGLRCTICFSYLGSAEEAFEKGDNASFTTMTHLFQCLRFSTRAGKVEETNLPLCLLCEENLVEVKRVVDQIIELENVVQSLEDEVKSKLINSFDESLLEPESHMMEKVAKVRAEMVQLFRKKRNRCGLKRTKTVERTEPNAEVVTITIPENVTSIKMKQEVVPDIRKSSSGRIIKRPRTYLDMVDGCENIIEDSLKPCYAPKQDATSSDPTSIAKTEIINAYTEEDTSVIDPEWSPPTAIDLDVLPSVVSEAEDELVDVGYKPSKPIKKPIKPSLKKRAKNKSKQNVREHFNRGGFGLQVPRIPVKIATKSGEILNAVYFDFKDINTTGSLSMSNEEHIFAIEDMKNIQGLRLSCYETLCPRTFTSVDKLKAHFKKIHPNSSAGLWQCCNFCDQRFSSVQQLRSHKKDAHSDTSADSELKTQCHPCTFDGCDRTYKNAKELKIHIRSVHTFETPFSCDFCEERFVSLVRKEVHVESCHPEAAPLKCELCPKGFFRNHRLRDHVKSHTGEKRFLCDLCGQAFSQPAYLRYHQTKHTELKLEPYKCSECDKTFATPVNLRIHRKTQHLKEYRFRCEVCNHGATHKSHLKLHMRTHSGDRPYSCPQCEKTFTRGSQLKIHLRSHSGERPYKCTSCDKSFTNSSKLRRHEHVHSAEKPFKCSICEKTFSQATNLNSHVRSCHTHKKESKKKQQPEPPQEFTADVREVIQFPAHMFGLVDQNIHIQVINSSEGLDGAEAFTECEYILLN